MSTDRDLMRMNYIAAMRTRRTAMYISLLCLMTAGAIYLTRFLYINSYNNIILTSGAFTFVGIAVFLYAYLWAVPLGITNPEFSVSETAKIRGLIFQFEQIIQNVQTYEANTQQFTADEKTFVQEGIEAAFDNIIYSQFSQELELQFNKDLFASNIGRKIIVDNANQILKYLRERLNLEIQASYSTSNEAKRSQENAFLIGNRVHTRLQNEIDQLFKRGNVYIIFGTVVALTGGVYLYFVAQEILGAVAQGVTAEDTVVGFAYKDVPILLLRLSIVVFIEIFAFYFLRLHKEAMENIKYYQNELTNVDMKTIALNAAYSTIEKAALDTIVKELCATERNFVLEGKQTTIEIQKLKASKDVLTESLDKLTRIIKKQ